ncbi:MAG TPA: SDR family oxidoreductase [Candidatus Dormibacteraeota bacterium]|nr:SDR family oxidoreductase [Candidatus Dormibacteraeota bacterium]
MVLVVGATGQVGGQVARMLLARGEAVRLLARRPERLAGLRHLGAEVVEGDLLAPATLVTALAGCSEVITTANGGGLPPARQVVDREGNTNLIQAAIAARVGRLVFLSARSAAPDSPVDLFRWKWETEQRLQASPLDHVILRPTHLMETWIQVLGPAALKGRVALFGKGTNPIAFVAAADVARVAVAALREPRASRRTLELGGPAAVSLGELVEGLETILGRRIRRHHLPLPLLAALSRLLRPWSPVLARQLGFSLLIESTDQLSRDQSAWELFPGPRTTVEQFLRAWVATATAPAREVAEGEASHP